MAPGVITMATEITLQYQLTDEIICLIVMLSAVKGLLMWKSGQNAFSGSSSERSSPRSYNWYTIKT